VVPGQPQGQPRLGDRRVNGSGYIKLWRDIESHWIWQDAEKLRAWLDLLIRASYHASKVVKGGRLVTVTRGQVFTSQKALATAWGWDRKTVRGFLDLLKADEMVDFTTDTSGATGYTLITICNYDKWQGNDKSDTDTQADTRSRLDGHSLPTFKKEKKESNYGSRGDEAPTAATQRPVGEQRQRGRLRWKREARLADAEWLATLMGLPVYAGLDIDRELGKMEAWFMTPQGRGRKKTRTFVVNWLNRALDERREVRSQAPLQGMSKAERYGLVDFDRIEAEKKAAATGVAYEAHR
jgi:hypothetical protein